MDEYDRAAYIEDGMNPDDPVVIARHEFAIQALRDYGLRLGIRRQCPPEPIA